MKDKESLAEEENRKIEIEFEKTIDHGIITGGLCNSPEAQAEFDKNQKGKPPLIEKTD